MATMTVTEVRRKLYHHDTDFEHADLSGLDLTGFTMRGINGYRANFSGSNCEGVLFDGATLTYADFTGANLRYVSFRSADLEHARFNQAYMAATVFESAHLDSAQFVGAINLPTTDHTLIGSLLLATAGEDIVKQAIASMVMVNYDYCWASFAKKFLDNPMFSSPAILEWVTQTFRPYPSLAGKLSDTLAWAERMKAREMRGRYERNEQQRP